MRRTRERADGFKALSAQGYLTVCEKKKEGRKVGHWFCIMIWCVAILATIIIPFWLEPLCVWLQEAFR